MPSTKQRKLRRPPMVFKTRPKQQVAQKCPWCFEWLLGDQKTSIYNGNDPDYQGWTVHSACNLSKYLDSDSDSDDSVHGDSSDSASEKLLLVSK